MREWSDELSALGYGDIPILKVPADPELFSPGEPTSEERTLYGCDISYVSTISSDAVHEIFSGDTATANPRMRKMYRDAYARLEKRLTAGKPPFSPNEYRKILREHVGSHNIAPDVEKEQTLMLEAHPGRTAIRGLAMEWLLEAGFDVHLYGGGWEEHPVLGAHQRGKIPYGAPLSALIRSSKIHLCVHGIWTLTMKVLDCFAAGGFPIVGWVDPGRDTEPIAEWFQEDRDVVLYRTREELLDKCRYYLIHPEQRREISMRGREIVLNHFTYRHTAEAILAAVRGR